MSQKYDIKKLLQCFGWYEGRKINTDAIKLGYQEYGYELFPAVLRFIEEFGGLEIILSDPDDESEDRHHTITEELLCDYYRIGQFEVEEQYAGERLVPVGEVCNANLLLFVSESGKIYHSTGKLGNNVWEAWDALFNNTGFKDWQDLQRERT